MKEWREDAIPCRLRHVDGFRWWLQEIQARRVPTVHVNGIAVRHTTLTNALVDAGLAACRSLMQILGISTTLPAKRGDPVSLKHYKPPGNGGNDVTADELRIEPVDLDTLKDREKEALVYVLAMANRAVAHPGVGPREADVDLAVEGCDLITRLVEARIYDGRPRGRLPAQLHQPPGARVG